VWLIIFWNLLAFFLALIFAIGYYKKKKKEKVSQIRAELWGTAVFIGVMIFFNGIILYANYSDEQRVKAAYTEMEKNNEERGKEEEESFANLELSHKTDKNKGPDTHYIYVANFNKKVSFHGKVYIKTIINNKIVDGEYTTKKITIKPGEKKQVDQFDGRSLYDSYSWEWKGELN
jgi:hypothetical protein